MANPLPVRSIAGHLVWGTDGAVWACFEVEPFAYAHRSVRDARGMHARTAAALLALPAHSLILSVAHGLSREELEGRVRGTRNLVRPPGWVGVARRVGDRLAAEPVYERRWFLALRLPDSGGGRSMMGRIRVASMEVASVFGSPSAPPGPGRLAVLTSQASLLADQLSQHLGIRALDAGEVRWLYERAVLRGLIDPPLPHPDSTVDRVSVVRLDRDAIYFEGGRRTDPDRPSHWRYLTVEHPDHGTGHQAFCCLAEIPSAWTFPYGSGEWLWHLDDQLPFPLDWAVRIETIDNQAARRRALRAKRNLVGQLTEPGSDPAGPATTLAAAADAVDEHRARLESNPALPALRATTIVALAHRHLDNLEHRVAVLESAFRAAEFNFYRPTGAQLACFTAMLPGAPPLPVVREYAQDLLPDGLASAMPFAGSGVGDPGGMLLGTSLDGLYRRPVFLDPGHGPRDLNRSGSLAAIGELGVGKSFLAKTLAHNTVAMGGQVVAIDRTERGEYARLAQVAAGTTQVVEISADAEVCLDPFQVFDTDELRLRYGVGFITLLTATPPGSTAGTHCYRAAQHTLEQASESGLPARLRDVIDDLETSGGPGGDVADKLRALSQISYGRLVFGDPGPPVDLGADYVCFHVPGLRLPRRHSQRDDQLSEELLGHAILYLVAAFSRQVLFRHPDRFAALLLDEAHALTASAQGHGLVMDLIRDGRKHFAAVWAFSQLATDLTGESDTDDIDALLGYRVVFRQSTQTAVDALRFLGSDDRDDNVETVTTLGTGECLMRDPSGRLGLIRITVPDDPAVADAFSTTPGTNRVAVGPWPSLSEEDGASPLVVDGITP
ncbi:MAG: ATP-binding protein [Acidimicrobiia bacterium]|nr:ATP-binding protein [Acidimicrobiia bacterium]